MPDATTPLQKILIVEDDLKLARLMAGFLEQHGFDVAAAHHGDRAVEAFERFSPHVTILDLMLPGRDGLQICRDLRRMSAAPILMLTAREDDIDEILGLESGADDYVTKPVDPRVLLARIRALLRRNSVIPVQAGRLEFGALVIDRPSRLASLDGEPTELSTMEFELLSLLADRAGQVLSRDEILNALRGVDFDGQDRSVDVCIGKLRRKLKDDPRRPRRIKTVWGKGYLFSPRDWEG
jgi:two-component system, OmpR family, response regulator ParR